MSKKYKGLRGLSPKQNANYLSSKEGAEEYDRELDRLRENRKRYSQYVKEKQAFKRFDDRFN